MILSGEKKLLALKQLKSVNVGHYLELSVKKLYEDFANRDSVRPYMPPKVGKGKTINKTYFWNVVNTLHEEELQSMLKFANEQRNSVGEQHA